MDIIRKDKYNIIYNHYNEHIETNFGQESVTESDNDDILERSLTGMMDQSQAQQAAQENLKKQLSDEQIGAKEEELQVAKKRIREKQKLFLELIKQLVSITKLRERNVKLEKQNEFI